MNGNDKIWDKATIELVHGKNTDGEPTTELQVRLYGDGKAQPRSWKNQGFCSLAGEDQSVLTAMNARDAKKFTKLGFVAESPARFVAASIPNGLVLKAWKLLNKGDNEVVEHFVTRSSKKGRTTDADFDDEGKPKKHGK